MRFVGIDPSTKTGIVALNEHGQILLAKELTGIGTNDPKRMLTLIDEVISHIKNDDFIVIEGFSYGSKGKGIAFQFGLGWGIRMALAKRGIQYMDVSPAAVKKFATGKGNAKKDAMAVPIYKHWGFEHPSDNVRDAFVIAQIAKALHQNSDNLFKYQKEVLNAILKVKKG